jgi:hypothetical protein
VIHKSKFTREFLLGLDVQYEEANL